MVIYYLRYLSFLGATSSLLNWSIACSADLPLLSEDRLQMAELDLRAHYQGILQSIPAVYGYDAEIPGRNIQQYPQGFDGLNSGRLLNIIKSINGKIIAYNIALQARGPEVGAPVPALAAAAMPSAVPQGYLSPQQHQSVLDVKKAKYNRRIIQRDAELTASQALIAQKDTALTASKALLAQKDTALGVLRGQLAQKDTALTDLQSQMNERDADHATELVAKDRIIAALLTQLNEVGKVSKVSYSDEIAQSSSVASNTTIVSTLFSPMRTAAPSPPPLPSTGFKRNADALPIPSSPGTRKIAGVKSTTSMPEKRGGVDLLAEIRSKQRDELCPADEKLLTKINRYIEHGIFKPLFTAAGKSILSAAVAPSASNDNGLARVLLRRISIAGEESDNESDSGGWSDDEGTNETKEDSIISASTSTLASSGEKLDSELYKFKRVRQVYRDAIKSHNREQRNETDKIFPVPERGAHKNMMLLWEWKYYRGNMQMIDNLVEKYIENNQAALQAQYKDIDFENVKIDYKSSTLIARASEGGLEASLVLP